MTTFKDFMKEIKNEAKAEGPKAIAELKALRRHFRRVRVAHGRAYVTVKPRRNDEKGIVMLKVVISLGGEILEMFTKHNVEDALWLRDYYVQAGFKATVIKA